MVAGKAYFQFDLLIREFSSSFLSLLKETNTNKASVPAINLSSVTHKLETLSRTGFIIVTLKPITIMATAPYKKPTTRSLVLRSVSFTLRVATRIAEITSNPPSISIKLTGFISTKNERRIIIGLYKQSTIAVNPAPSRFRALKKSVSDTAIPRIPLIMSTM